MAASMVKAPNDTPHRQLAPGEFVGVADHRLELNFGVIAFIREQERIERHEHSDTHFVLVVEGEYLTAAQNAGGAVGPGDVLLNTPGTRHEDQFAGAGKLITFSVADKILDTFTENSGLSGAARRVRGGEPAAALNAIAREASDLDEVSDLEIEGLTYELLASATGQWPATRKPPWLERARAQIRHSSGGALSIKTLARDADVHPVHLTRAFRAFFGQTPGAMTRRIRMQKAASLLARTHSPICEIALECGFSDQAAFTKAFKRASSISPLVFRRRWRR